MRLLAQIVGGILVVFGSINLLYGLGTGSIGDKGAIEGLIQVVVYFGLPGIPGLLLIRWGRGTKKAV